MIRLCSVLVAAALLAGCANSGTGNVPPKTVHSVDLKRYQGTWYEQARLPMRFQKDCVKSEAKYTLQDDGSVDVLNSCVTAQGELQQAHGKAVAQVPGETDKLWVNFDNWFSNLLPGLTKGDYWVLYLDKDYQSVLVGTPNHKYLWLMTRNEKITQEQRTELLKQARSHGYETAELIWRQ
ncbi:lipocalin family protein [Pseudomonas sp. 5P_3.1_Bac2]|uniref:lipocalin family protein n=1 Tax=Pseudomonas sp. 5P_3.1_Bac2 TaxID=2971617 RepID=UPI0021C7CDEA|nr:lipocalin family protein [Pseudomonas sp. 5P_3.1_Bac2]MCU1717885.1 lipocalin family protein [Pseudomonas sp. 5P_3.1_Bac2]